MADFEYYTKEGKSYERVTRILDYFQPPELVDWKLRVGKTEANKVSKIALKFGSRVHELIETNSACKKSDADEVRNCMIAWNSWKANYVFKGMKIENGVTLYDEFRSIAGTPDFIYENRLIDIKTSREVKPIHFLQLGGYASMMMKMPEQLAILRLDKSLGAYEYVLSDRIGMSVYDCINAFNHLFQFYRFYREVQSTLKPKEPMAQEEDI